MKKTMILIISLLALTLTASNALSWDHGKHRFRGNCQGFSDNAWQELSDEQKTQIKDLRQQFVDDTYEIRSSLAAKHSEMRMLLETSAPDPDRLEALSTQLLDLQKSLRDKRIDFVLAAKKIAPELRLGMGPQMGQARARFHGKGGGRGFGPCQNNPYPGAPEDNQSPTE